MLFPNEWRNFYARWSGGGLVSVGTLFLHERTTHSGQRRLVAADLNSVQGTVITVDTRVFSPPVALAAAKLEHVGTSAVSLAPDAEGIILYAGESDPNDLSHFTIRFALANKRGVLDGWLKEDGNVLIELRAATASDHRTSAITSPAQPSPATSR
jgi:hypothetical protein